MLRLALRNYSVLLENKIFLVEEKRTCFQLKIGLSTEAASFFLLGVFCLIVCFKRYVKTCRKRFNGFEVTLWKDVPKRSWVFRPAQTFSMGVRQNGTYLLSENMK